MTQRDFISPFTTALAIFSPVCCTAAASGWACFLLLLGGGISGGGIFFLVFVGLRRVRTKQESLGPFGLVKSHRYRLRVRNQDSVFATKDCAFATQDCAFATRSACSQSLKGHKKTEFHKSDFKPLQERISTVSDFTNRISSLKTY
jgi:hypothetical protein